MARPTLQSNPKWRRLVAALGDNPALARGALELLWDVAYESGNDEIGDAVDVELAAGWRGSPGALVRALLDAGGVGRAGFIEEVAADSGRYKIHDLWDHAPRYVATRAAREAEREHRGETISTVRAASGRKGAATRWQKESVCHSTNGKQAASESQSATTPARAPARAPAQEAAAAVGLEIEDASGPRGDGPPTWPKAVSFRRALTDAMARTALYPVGGRELETWTSLEASLSEIPEADAVEICRGRILAAVAASKRQPGTLSYFAQVLADEAQRRRHRPAPEPPPPDPAANCPEAALVFAALRERVEATVYAQWIQPLRPEYVDGKVVLHAADECRVELLTERFGSILAEHNAEVTCA